MDGNVGAILGLLCTSLIVRVVPSFLPLKFEGETKVFIEEILPTSVFICFITYIVMSEMAVNMFASLISVFALICFSVFWNKGLILTTFVSSIVYFLSSRLLF